MKWIRFCLVLVASMFIVAAVDRAIEFDHQDHQKFMIHQVVTILIGALLYRFAPWIGSKED